VPSPRLLGRRPATSAQRRPRTAPHQKKVSQGGPRDPWLCCLGRPVHLRRGAETVNDADYFLANFWRAIRSEPLKVAEWADWPINETDLHARHRWLITEGRQRLIPIADDPDFYDAKVAGWWVWGLCMWVGTEWCVGRGPHSGIRKKMPAIADNGGKGIFAPSNQGRVPQMLTALSDRLRNVRVVCGDWHRVCADSVLRSPSFTITGIYLDPPYPASIAGRKTYLHETTSTVEVARWAISKTDSPRLRVAFSCRSGDEASKHLETAGWTCLRWTAASKGRGPRAKRNAVEEIWFSPSCITATPTLFEQASTTPQFVEH